MVETMALNEEMERKRQAFMDLLESGRKISAYNLFHNVYTSNKGLFSDPLRLLTSVEIELKRRVNRYSNDGRDREILDAIRDNSALAFEYAEYVIWYCSLPYEERKDLRWQRMNPYLPPTPKQLAYLIDLGYRDDVAKIKNRKEASDLIEEMILENSRKG